MADNQSDVAVKTNVLMNNPVHISQILPKTYAVVNGCVISLREAKEHYASKRDEK